MSLSKVYFSKEITSKKLVEIFHKLDNILEGNIAIKVHSGEAGNQNYLKPSFMKDLIDELHGTVVECNTAYEGKRNTTNDHLQLLKDHEWSKYFKVDIMDSNETDLEIEIPNGIRIKKNYLGKNIENYDSMLVISHFKGHPMGGFGGALKQLSIGCASSKGKRYIHCAGKENGTYEDMFRTEQDEFLESMADAAYSVVNYFDRKILYINIMCNLSVDCDCCKSAEDPCMKDIGILASTDPVALDQACIDLVINSNDPGRDKLLERINSKNGTYIIDCASKLNVGSKNYELIDID